MRHAKRRYSLNRFTSWRKSTLNSITKSLLIRQRIITTKVKARAAIAPIEKLISLAKEDSIARRRNAYAILGEHKLVTSLFKEIAPRFNKKTSGFTRLIPYGFRRGDGAELVILELTEQKEKVARPKKEKVSAAEKPPVKEKELPKEKEVTKEQAISAKAKVHTEEKVLPSVKKPSKEFLGGLRKIFKKKSDSL